jgi:hypothetical protein
MARWILIVPAVAVMASCSANWHLKRAIAKDPSIVKPTAVRFDTIVVTRERKLTDTIVMNDVDTITIERDRVRVRLVRSYDTLMVEGTCLPDTIKIDVIREIPQVVQPRRWRDQFNLWVSVVLLIFSIAFAVSRWRRW